MEGQELDLPWLEPLIKAKFYVPCQCGLKDSTYFCIVCKCASFCEFCKISKHDGHNVLKVYKASYQVGIKSGEISEWLDISDVQSYIINSKRIVYITQRQSKRLNNHKGGDGQGSDNQCETCGWSNLFTPAKFCSIQCKVRLPSEEEEQEEELKNNGLSDCSSDTILEKVIRKLVTTKPTSSSTDKWTFQASQNSYRKRSRKGLPKRSPLM